jgi:hypothetical protein
VVRSVRRKSSLSPKPSGSFFESANDLLASFRYKAANALTSTLPEEQRKELTNKLLEQFPQQVKVVAEEEQIAPKSIAEAVEAARMEEATRQESKSKQAMEAMLEKANKAAQARVESELAIQKRRIENFEVWNKNLAAEKKEHPILGQVVSDLGHARYHLVPAKELANIAVWEKQRTYRHKRAQNMAADKMKSLHLGISGVIVLHEVWIIHHT